MNGTGANKRARARIARRLPGSSTFRLGTLLAVVIVVGAGAVYEGARCSRPCAERPVFGRFTIHCEWRERRVHSLSIYDYLTDTRPRFDPITHALLNRMALTAAKKELGHLGSVDTAAELDAEVFGSMLPCRITVFSTEFANPRALNLKPRSGTGKPPVDVDGLPCAD